MKVYPQGMANGEKKVPKKKPAKKKTMPKKGKKMMQGPPSRLVPGFGGKKAAGARRVSRALS